MHDRKLTITTGGVNLPLKPFVKETIENVIIALLEPLKKTNLEGEIVIKIGPAGEE